MAHEDEEHGTVRLEARPEQRFGYARHVWAVLIDREQRGWIVRPEGIGASHEAWSMHQTPRRRCVVGRTGLLARAFNPAMPEEERQDLAGRFAALLATDKGRERLPTKAELAASGPPRPERAPRARKDVSMRAALGGIRISEPRRPRVDDEGRPLPGIGYIP